MNFKIIQSVFIKFQAISNDPFANVLKYLQII